MAELGLPDTAEVFQSDAKCPADMLRVETVAIWKLCTSTSALSTE